MSIKKIFFLIPTLLILSLASCQKNNEVNQMIEKQDFGTTPDGKKVYLFTLTNNSGAKVKITNYGAAVVALIIPDRNGKMEDVVTGFENLEGYINDKSFFGVTVGRYGNRIANSKFKIDGIEYTVTANEGENHLHGGNIGFFKAVWDAEPLETEEGPAVKLTLLSPDGDEGYPGNVNMEVVYTFTNTNELIIDYKGTTDKPTVLNPTHHSYFNISGDFTKPITSQILQIDADYYTPVNDKLITTGELAKVENTPLDFRQPQVIGDRINDDFIQLKYSGGYDHNWVINGYDGKVKKAVELYEPVSGRVLEVLTDQPGVQFYSGNFMNGTITGKGGVVYNHRTGLCLEPQHFPDSPNKPDFPSTILRPGETYKQTTIYRFSTK